MTTTTRSPTEMKLSTFKKTTTSSRTSNNPWTLRVTQTTWLTDCATTKWLLRPTRRRLISTSIPTKSPQVPLAWWLSATLGAMTWSPAYWTKSRPTWNSPGCLSGTNPSRQMSRSSTSAEPPMRMTTRPRSSTPGSTEPPKLYCVSVQPLTNHFVCRVPRMGRKERHLVHGLHLDRDVYRRVVFRHALESRACRADRKGSGAYSLLDG